MDDQASKRRPIAILWIAISLAVAAIVAALLVWRRQLARRPRPEPQPMQPDAVLDLQGLTEEEAAARRLEGQDNAILFNPPYSKREILRANTLTIFNLSLVGLAAVQILLGKPLDAILTGVVLAFNIGINVGQEFWARRRLQGVEQAARPLANIVREGKVRSIDPGEVVRGDILVVGPGDQVLADGQVLGEGQIVVDESMLTGDSHLHTRRGGDPVYAGSFCISGYGPYEAQKVGSERLIAALTDQFQAIKEELTPLERIVDRILRILLVVVAGLIALLLLDYYDFLLQGLHVDAVSSAASVIFGLAPASLLLMILVNYTMGTADLTRVGALVHRSRSVESLAQSTVICFAQAGIVTGVGVEVEPIASPGPSANGTSQPDLAESRIRQILGDYGRSTSADSRVVQAMAGAFPGGRRNVREEAPFLSVYGWSGIAFDDPDLRGVYVLGDPQVLESHLTSGTSEPAPKLAGGSALDSWRDWFSSFRRLFGQARNASTERKDGSSPSLSPEEPAGARNPSASTPARKEADGDSLFQRLMVRVNSMLGRQEQGEAHTDVQATSSSDGGAPVQQATELVYLVAYQPDLEPLHSGEGAPRLPAKLIPLCRLYYSEQIRPDAIETAQELSKAGVSLKIFTPDAPEHAAGLLAQAGIGSDGGIPLPSVTAPELAALDRERLAQAASENTLFGQVTPEQAGQLVSALREQGKVVAVVGDGVNDLPAMQKAHLSITRHSSSPVLLSMADMVLLKGWPQVLSSALDKGQRVANGLFDVLKLYLTNLCYLTLLILVIWGTGIGFPYQSKQGSLIAITTLVLPSLSLYLWAAPGVLPRKNLDWHLARFVVPAGATISAAATVVYLFFLSQTGEETYAQLALTWMLVISGLAVVVLVRPPFQSRIQADRDSQDRSGDWRPAVWVLVLLALVFLVAQIPLADQLFGLTPLRQPLDYLVVVLAVLAWALTANLIWWIAPLRRLEQAARS